MAVGLLLLLGGRDILGAGSVLEWVVGGWVGSGGAG